MGYFHIYTGNGKGKTTAAFGLALRSVGRRRRVFVGQFLKHEASGEALAFRLLPGTEHRLFGAVRGVYEPLGEADRVAAQAGLAAAREILQSGQFDLVILDELNVAVSRGLLDIEAVLGVIASREPRCELVVTGRDAHPRLVEAADLVTEMREIKHYAARGVVAREGVEY